MKRVRFVFCCIALPVVIFAATARPTPPKLDKDEVQFKKLIQYQRDDFNLAWKVSYFDVVTFVTKPSDGKHFELPETVRFRTVMKVGSVVMNSKRERELMWLANAILTRDYFWKAPWPPVFIYDFTSLRFIENGSRFKAIETRKDILDMLGDIDTPAELHLWIEANRRAFSKPFSYKKISSQYRVRFRDLNPYSCHYKEYFHFYSQEGKLLKRVTVREYRDKACVPVTP